MDEWLKSKTTAELLDLYDELREIEEYGANFVEIEDDVYDDSEIKRLRKDSLFMDSVASPAEGKDSWEKQSNARRIVSRRDIRPIICAKYNQEIADSGVEGADEYRVVFSDNDTLDQVRLIKNPEELTKNVQAYILNLSAPSSLDELMQIYEDDLGLDMEEAVGCSGGLWTAPRWAKLGDIIFYTHAKTARAKISSTRTELRRSKAFYTISEYEGLDSLIDKECELHSQYGGTIFAVGQLSGAPRLIPEEELREGFHYKTQIYAEVDNMVSFPNPVSVDECKDFLHISMTSGITPVDGDIFDSLKDRLKEKNSIPLFLKDATATPLPLSRINETNWMTLANDFRRSFMYEIQFRHYYVDYLLKALSGRKKIFRECRCKKNGIGNSYIDNVIWFEGKYLPVEVKLSIRVEKNIKKQVGKYCYDDFIVLDEANGRVIDQRMTYNNRVLIVDTFCVYMYDYEEDEIKEISSLDELVDLDSVYQLRDDIWRLLCKDTMDS